MRLAICISVFIFTSCASTTDKRISKVKEDEMKIHIMETFNKADSTAVVDSVRFIKIDTFSQKMKYNSINSRVVQRMKELNAESEYQLEKYKSNINLAGLARGLSSSLYRT